MAEWRVDQKFWNRDLHSPWNTNWRDLSYEKVRVSWATFWRKCLRLKIHRTRISWCCRVECEYRRRRPKIINLKSVRSIEETYNPNSLVGPSISTLSKEWFPCPVIVPEAGESNVWWERAMSSFGRSISRSSTLNMLIMLISHSSAPNPCQFSTFPSRSKSQSSPLQQVFCGWDSTELKSGRKRGLTATRSAGCWGKDNVWLVEVLTRPFGSRGYWLIFRVKTSVKDCTNHI